MIKKVYLNNLVREKPNCKIVLKTKGSYRVFCEVGNDIISYNFIKGISYFNDVVKLKTVSGEKYKLNKVGTIVMIDTTISDVEYNKTIYKNSVIIPITFEPMEEIFAGATNDEMFDEFSILTFDDVKSTKFVKKYFKL